MKDTVDYKEAFNALLLGLNEIATDPFLVLDEDKVGKFELRGTSHNKIDGLYVEVVVDFIYNNSKKYNDYTFLRMNAGGIKDENEFYKMVYLQFIKFMLFAKRSANQLLDGRTGNTVEMIPVKDLLRGSYDRKVKHLT